MYLFGLCKFGTMLIYYLNSQVFEILSEQELLWNSLEM